MKRILTVIFLVIYGGITLIGRLYIEPMLGIGPLGSLGVGLACLGVIVIMFKAGILSLSPPESKSRLVKK